MTGQHTLSPLRTTVIGSYPLPSWLEFACAHLEQFGATDRAELQEPILLAEDLPIKRQINRGLRWRQTPQCFGARPDFLQQVVQFSNTIHFSEGHLTRRHKEMIASYVSYLNRCPY